MLEIKIINNPQEYLQEAEKFFSASFCRSLQEEKPGTYVESLVARYFIKKKKNNFSSISHKDSLVFIASSDSNVGIDIEIIKKRDENLLEKFSDGEYGILGEKNWVNFYTLWTAKESIIKYENLLLDDMKNIVLDSVEVFGGKIGSVELKKKLVFQYKEKNFLVYSGDQENQAFSVCVSYELG